MILPITSADLRDCAAPETLGGNDAQDRTEDAERAYAAARLELHELIRSHIGHLEDLLKRIDSGQTYATYSKFDIADFRHRLDGFRELLRRAKKLDEAHKEVANAIAAELG